MDALAQTLARSPELFPHTLDVATDTVSLVRLSEQDYARASFLDARILTPATPGRSLPFTQLEAAVAELPEACDFIFHIGHVGSTLLSRLLGAHARIFSLREPMILRMLAQMRTEPQTQPRRWSDAEFEARLSTFMKLWSRAFGANQRALIKATSFASELASPILARASNPKAVFMFAGPQTYLATILGGENSRMEARILGPSRLHRLQQRLGPEGAKLAIKSEGEAIAMSWACEMHALNSAPQARALWLDFDRFLTDPPGSLLQTFRHLGVDASEGQAREIIAGPDMRRYSKAQEYEYDAKLRSDVLARARGEHAAEIARGLSWLDRAAAEFAPLREVLETGRRYSPR